ncbi:MAG: hypothetical protein QGG17_04675 [Rhodospirillales bacterium]|jgi:hypothetical protein|nr:hypothetical protein [Rhodospirillales bacterium]MDP6805087.1 hypothetical protein [Rhodospirillales bacterium]
MDAATLAEDRTLTAIPFVDVGRKGPLAVLEAEPEKANDLLLSGQRYYGATALTIGDALSRRWLRHAANPYGREIASLAEHVGTPGIYLLNLSYEWTCTTAVGADPIRAGNRMLRSLDWPLAGLGRNLVVARHEADAGPYLSCTWPGFSGVATAMAPMRFSAAINQPPMRKFTSSPALDWLIGWFVVWRRHALPPTHLLREVFETCRSFAEAKTKLVETPICVPAFFTLSGIDEGDGCVIERTRDDAFVHAGPIAADNHWLEPRLGGWPRGADSVERLAEMTARAPQAGDEMSWLVPPILNATTRLAAVANARSGTLVVRGFEADGPATALLTV